MRVRTRFAVLMDFVFSEFQEEIKNGLDRYFREADIDSIYFGLGKMTQDNPEDRAKMGFIEMIGPIEFDGVILLSTSFSNFGNMDFIRKRLAGIKDLPMISIGQSIFGEESISLDNESGMKQIMRHLIDDHGYRDFAYVSGPFSNEESNVRLSVFRASLESEGIPYNGEAVYEGNFLTPSGESAVAELLDVRGLRPDVIVCANDLMALGVWSAVKARGLNVPYDIAITGYDDMHLSHALSSQFTTVKQSFGTLGYLAAKRLHARLGGMPCAPLSPLANELRVRSSCGCVDFSSRSDALRSKDEAGSEEKLTGAILDYIAKGCPESESAGLWRAWGDRAWHMLNNRETVWALEEVIREVSVALAGGGSTRSAEGNTSSAGGSTRSAGENKALLSDLYAFLLEECGQKAFVEHWKEVIFSLTLRVLVDRLQESLVKTLSLSAQDEAFREIVEFSGARELYIARFNDFGNIFAGSRVVYSTGEGKAAEGGRDETVWAPGPSAWFPSGSRSLAANMVSSGDDRFGFILIDAANVNVNLHDYLRIRFSGISKDLLYITNIHRLNEKLQREVSVREEAELKLKEALAMVEHLSIADELTGLRNRRGFFALAEQQIKYLRRQGGGFFVVYADLDGLKAINDGYGHNDGDLAIRAAGEILQRALRDSDIVARIGGDEFTALVSKAEPPNYAVIKERILEGCERKTRELGRPWKLSMSIGHYHAEEGCALSLTEMLEKADAELYKEKQAKKAARNK